MPAKIFISHASANREIINPFIEFLQLVFNIGSQEIAYTSLPETGLDNFSNFNEALRTRIHESMLAVIFLTKEYIQSQYCMCELGALWAIRKKCFLFNVGNLSKSCIPDVLLATTYSVLDSAALDEFYEIFSDTFPETKKELKLKELNSIKSAKLQVMLDAVEKAKEENKNNRPQETSQDKPIEELDAVDIESIMAILEVLSTAAKKAIDVSHDLLTNTLVKGYNWDFSRIQYSVKLCITHGFIEKSQDYYNLTDKGCTFHTKRKQKQSSSSNFKPWSSLAFP